ncbi:MAG: ferrous iron transport protein B [Woeseia sp.]
MASRSVSRVPVDQITVRRRPSASIAVVGNPNSGKSTLFNRLTGLRQRTANYPGATVEKHVGTANVGNAVLELIDLPGTFSLTANSMEERIAVDVILGRMPGTNPPAGILAVVDMTNLYQGLYLVQQLLEIELPVVVALTMSDAADLAGLRIDLEALQVRLGGATVCPVVATTGQGMNALRKALAGLSGSSKPDLPAFWPELNNAAARISAELEGSMRRIEIERALVDAVGELEHEVLSRLGTGGDQRLAAVRQELFGDEPPLAKEARYRYRWVREVLDEVQRKAPPIHTWGSRVSGWFNRPVPGTIGLFVVMAIVFQAVFAWATPIMDVIDTGAAALGSYLSTRLADGALTSLLADGVVAGVGSVIVFLPQITILFLFIILLEDSGYLARAAYLMDRAMRAIGLSGQSIIPLISSFACAVPSIMATRVIPNRRDRIATMLAAPFMTCSARLPIYALMIAAFVPAKSVGWINVQGLVLFGLYVLGIVAGVLTALLLRVTALRGPKPPFALMLPEFRRPNSRTVLMQLLGRVRVFLRRAGTVIFTVAVVVWALAYFPRSETVATGLAERRAIAETTLAGGQLAKAVQELEHRAAADQLAQSWLGRAGRAVGPVFRPLGWDWRVSAAVIAGFPAREVVVAVLGTVYAVGDEANDATLAQRLKSATWPDGAPVYTLPMVFGLLIFYACCLQCASTLAVIQRETNSWRWPAFAWVYMTSIGYLGALVVYQLGSS